MVTVFLRTLIIYLILITGMRLAGKRQIGEMQVSELVVTFMLSELAVFPISDKNVPVSHAVIPIVLLLSLEVIFSFVQTKSSFFKKLMDGKPTVLIKRGKLDISTLAENRIDIEELLGELRLKGAFDPADVEYAVLEENGKLSVLMKSSVSPITPETLGMKAPEKGFSHEVITDGEVDFDSLRAAGRDRIWLDGMLERFKTSVEDVFLLTVDDEGGVGVYLAPDKSGGKPGKQYFVKPKNK
ncbi:MAG: DUF421 domain-containing protein [Clostridia bacterium]|nr:DUF421 domain-containing protein [Clostridia bacterium]